MGRSDRVVVRLWPDEKMWWQQAAEKLEYPSLSRLIRDAVERLIEFESLPEPIREKVEGLIELESMPDYVVPDEPDYVVPDG